MTDQTLNAAQLQHAEKHGIQLAQQAIAALQVRKWAIEQAIAAGAAASAVVEIAKQIAAFVETKQ